MQFIDSHCHLNYDYLPKTEMDLIAEATQVGVEAFITIGTDIASIPRVQEISEKYPQVFHTIGVHPHDVAQLSDEDLATLERAAKHSKCRAIGEIGLDYYYEHSDRPSQVTQLEKQLDLALRLKLPVVIHSREGEEDLLSALSRYAARASGERTPGVIHCFSGTIPFGKKCLDLGFNISFSGILTFKKADEVREAAKLFPLDKLLVETDAPFLAPVPYRGKKCEPAMVKLTAQKLAEVKGISLEEVAQVTTENAKRLFGI